MSLGCEFFQRLATWSDPSPLQVTYYENLHFLFAKRWNEIVPISTHSPDSKKINKTRSWCSSTRVLFRVPRLCLFFTPVGYRELIKFGTYGNIAKLNCVHSDVLLNFVFWPVVEFLAVCGRGPGELGRESRRESGMNSKGDFDIFLWYTDKIFRLVQFPNFNIQVEFFNIRLRNSKKNIFLSLLLLIYLSIIFWM